MPRGARASIAADVRMWSSSPSMGDVPIPNPSTTTVTADATPTKCPQVIIDDARCGRVGFIHVADRAAWLAVSGSAVQARVRLGEGTAV